MIYGITSTTSHLTKMASSSGFVQKRQHTQWTTKRLKKKNTPKSSRLSRKCKETLPFTYPQKFPTHSLTPQPPGQYGRHPRSHLQPHHPQLPLPGLRSRQVQPQRLQQERAAPPGLASTHRLRRLNRRRVLLCFQP